jgi:hypothetical protein
VQGLRTFVVVLGVFAMGVSLWSLVRGRVIGAATQNRRGTGILLAGSPVVFDAGGVTEPVVAVQGPGDEDVTIVAPQASTVDTLDAPEPHDTVETVDPLDAPLDAVETLKTVNLPELVTALQTAALATSTLPPVEPSSSPKRTTTAKTVAKAVATTAANPAAATTPTTARQKTATARPATRSTTGRPKTATTRPTKKPTTAAPACKASVDNPNPAAGGNVVVNVTSTVPTTPFTVTAHYKSKTKSLSSTTNGSGAGSVTFDIGSATKGYEVKVDVNISGQASCSTQFTPR